LLIGEVELVETELEEMALLEVEIAVVEDIAVWESAELQLEPVHADVVVDAEELQLEPVHGDVAELKDVELNVEEVDGLELLSEVDIDEAPDIEVPVLELVNVEVSMLEEVLGDNVELTLVVVSVEVVEVNRVLLAVALDLIDTVVAEADVIEFEAVEESKLLLGTELVRVDINDDSEEAWLLLEDEVLLFVDELLVTKFSSCGIVWLLKDDIMLLLDLLTDGDSEVEVKEVEVKEVEVKEVDGVEPLVERLEEAVLNAIDVLTSDPNTSLAEVDDE
jgi:hypothetical protein